MASTYTSDKDSVKCKLTKSLRFIFLAEDRFQISSLRYDRKSNSTNIWTSDDLRIFGSPSWRVRSSGVFNRPLAALEGRKDAKVHQDESYHSTGNVAAFNRAGYALAAYSPIGRVFRRVMSDGLIMDKNSRHQFVILNKIESLRISVQFNHIFW